MNGIHQRIDAKLTEIASANGTLQDADASPSASHDAFERLPRLKKELEELCGSAHVGASVAFDIEQGIAKLNGSPVKSAELQLAIRDLETAGFRLRQHLGPAPEPSKPAEAGAPFKLWIHEGKGHYIGSLVIVAAASKEEAEALIRAELDKCGLKTEAVNANEAPICNGKTLLTRSGDY